MALSFRCRIDQEICGQSQAVELRSPVDSVQAWEIDDVPRVLDAAETAGHEGLFAAGFVTYDAAPAFDRALVAHPMPNHRPHAGLPLAWFGMFAEMHPAPPARSSDSAAHLDPAPDNEHNHPVRGGDWTPETSSQQHASAIGEILAAIAKGDVYLVNLTTRFRRNWEPAEDAYALYEQLTAGHAGGFHLYVESPQWAVACGSPELFFELEGHHITTRPMKGTAPRGRWSQEDEELSSLLAESPKERAENVMVVDLLRNDLGRIAVPGSVEVPELWQVERHPGLWQLTSTVTAATKPEIGLTDVFGALFPSGSVTGAPKVAAMKTIAALETSKRGLYCGAVGLVQPGSASNGPGVSARFAVAIRTAVVDKRNQVAEYGSGGGITWDSDPTSEWNEVKIKTRSLLIPLPARTRNASLLETMAFRAPQNNQRGGGIRNLDRHLSRLIASAAYFSIDVPSDLQDRITDAVRGRMHDARIRLLLHRTGSIEIEVSDFMADGALKEPLMLCIDPEPVQSTDASLFHKTNDRLRYDERSARHPHADDVLLLNQRGEVTETTRANVVVLQHGTWWTPPLDCGLLPGVERARLLDSGQVKEQSISVEQLFTVDAIATVSSLRGWRQACLTTHCDHQTRSEPIAANRK